MIDTQSPSDVPRRTAGQEFAEKYFAAKSRGYEPKETDLAESIDVILSRFTKTLAPDYLAFRRAAARAVDKTIEKMVKDGDVWSGWEFKDPKTLKKCCVFVVLGDEAVKYAEEEWTIPAGKAGEGLE